MFGDQVPHQKNLDQTQVKYLQSEVILAGKARGVCTWITGIIGAAGAIGALHQVDLMEA